MVPQTTIPSIEYPSHQMTRRRVRPAKARKCHVILRKGGLKVELVGRNGFMMPRGSVGRNKENEVIHAALAGERPRLSWEDWCHVLYHINPEAIKHLEKRGPSEVLLPTVASKMGYLTCHGSISEALPCGHGGRTPKMLVEVVYTDIEGPFRPYVNGIRAFQVFLREYSRNKRVVALRTCGQGILATGHNPDQTLTKSYRKGWRLSASAVMERKNSDDPVYLSRCSQREESGGIFSAENSAEQRGRGTGYYADHEITP